MRKFSSTAIGATFDEWTVIQVWQKGTIVFGYDPSKYRKDTCGAWMSRSDYGNTDSNMGWEIDHIIPVARGGSDYISNLQPLQWQNNRRKSDDLNWSCAITG